MLEIYGSNTAYTSPSELYNDSTKGTLLGTMTFDNTSVELFEDQITELDITDNYKYIGIRTQSGAAYLKTIKITWEVTETPPQPEPTTDSPEPTTQEPTEAPTEEPTNPTYTIRWFDYDGTLLLSEEYEEGVTPAYPKQEPERDYDENYSYFFTGWSPTITEVTGNKDYTAQYQAEQLSFYTVTWKNYDNTVLDEREYPAGKTPKYYGERPYKPDDANYRYVFSGWSPALNVLIDHDITYTAQFIKIASTCSILSMDSDAVYGMINSYYKYGGEISELGDVGGFTVEGDKLKLGGKTVADVIVTDKQHIGTTVYVEGTGTYDDPYVFYPNYLYGKELGKIGGYQNNILIEDYHPGDGFFGISRIWVGEGTSVSFMADPSVNQETFNGYIGVGKNNYGYKYINANAVDYNDHGPYEFGYDGEVGYNGHYSLYYIGQNDSGSYVFSTVDPEHIGNFYQRVPEEEPDIFTKGYIEYFLDAEGHRYTYSNGVFSQVSEQDTEITELINQAVTPSESDPIFSYNSTLIPDFNDQYFGGRLLGFNKKLTNLSEETEIVDEETGSLRFMTVLSSPILKKLNDSAHQEYDYGYVFAVGSPSVNINLDNLTVDNPRANKYSCRGTYNTLSGDFGNNNYNSTDYKYITAGIDDIPKGIKFAARFYITYKGETHYITYPKDGSTGFVFNTADYIK